jgi:hypothetical protein
MTSNMGDGVVLMVLSMRAQMKTSD